MAAFDATHVSIHSIIDAQDQQQQQQQQNQQQNQQQGTRTCNNSAAAAAQLPGSAAELTIVIQNQMLQEERFKVFGSTTLREVFFMYKQRMLAAQPGNEPRYRFLFDGEYLKPDSTPNDYNMVEGDIIHVVLEQHGD
jgi:hypothetical protein